MANPSGARLEGLEELLLRQVHPNFVDNGRVSSQAFKPTPKDEGLLSVSRGSLTTGEDAHRLHTNERGLQSVGTWAVSLGECSALELNAFSDPIDAGPPDPAHAVVDFRQHANKASDRAAKLLRNAAEKRGPLFLPRKL